MSTATDDRELFVQIRRGSIDPETVAQSDTRDARDLHRRRRQQHGDQLLVWPEILPIGLHVPRPLMTEPKAAFAFLVTLWLHRGNLLTKAENLILVATYCVGRFVQSSPFVGGATRRRPMFAP